MNLDQIVMSHRDLEDSADIKVSDMQRYLRVMSDIPAGDVKGLSRNDLSWLTAIAIAGNTRHGKMNGSDDEEEDLPENDVLREVAVVESDGGYEYVMLGSNVKKNPQNPRERRRMLNRSLMEYAEHFCHGNIGEEYYKEAIEEAPLLIIQRTANNLAGFMAGGADEKDPTLFHITLVCSPTKESITSIKDLGGKPGSGSALLGYVERHLGQYGFRGISLDSVPQMVTFYYKNGYKFYNERGKTIGDLNKKTKDLLDRKVFLTTPDPNLRKLSKGEKEYSDLLFDILTAGLVECEEGKKLPERPTQRRRLFDCYEYKGAYMIKLF